VDNLTEAVISVCVTLKLLYKGRMSTRTLKIRQILRQWYHILSTFSCIHLSSTRFLEQDQPVVTVIGNIPID